jgi:hypothetical protein
MSTQIVKGYPCRDCTDVDLAKKRIDPAHPKDGPDGVDAPARKAAREEREKSVQALGAIPLEASGPVGTRFNALA